MNIYIDTCVLPRSRLEEGGIYRRRYGTALGFELLPMFDLADFEDDLKKNLGLLSEGPLIFHEPVWGVEHTALRGSPAWEESMFHIRLTRKYAEILRPPVMVYHLNNAPVPEEERDRMLKTSLENLAETRDLFPDVRIAVENTGVRREGTQLLDQREFTDLCRDRNLDVVIDVGHANANGWDVQRLIADLSGRIVVFHLHNNDGTGDQHRRLRDGTLDIRPVIRQIREEAPKACRVIEYTKPELHGEPLMEDIAFLRGMTEEEAGSGS